jgi:hypothetical protein
MDSRRATLDAVVQTREARIQIRINKFLFARRYKNKDDEKREMRDWIYTLTHKYSNTQVRDLLIYMHTEIDPFPLAIDVLVNEGVVELSHLRRNEKV